MGHTALFLLCVLVLPPALQAQFTYTTNNGTITITGYTGAGGAVSIPSTISGLPVTSIGINAFADVTALTNVIIPDSVISIGSQAFYFDTGLTGLTLGNSVTNIGGAAFYNCIGLTNVAIPNSVASVGGAAFSHCSHLITVAIGDGLTYIGSNAFLQCSGLTSITVDPQNSSFSSLDGVVFDKNQTTLVLYPDGIQAGYIVPNTVTNIGNRAFAGCYGLTSVTLDNSLTFIGTYAFSDCIGLTNVTIPNQVASISDYAFYNCENLLSVTIPSSVTNIGQNAFRYCYALKLVTLSNGLLAIGAYAFWQCTSLAGITIPDSVTSIGTYAFYNCSILTTAFFQGNAPTNLGTSIFAGDSVTVYYLPGTTGWSPTTFSGNIPAVSIVLWNPQAQTSGPGFGVQSNQFGFNITGTSNLVIVVEACTNLVNPSWSRVATNTLTGGSSFFTDPQWTNYTSRFYRFSSP